MARLTLFKEHLHAEKELKSTIDGGRLFNTRKSSNSSSSSSSYEYL